MKFTKEDCFEKIKTALGNTRVYTDRSINQDLDTLIPLIANEEMELDDFIGKTINLFKTADGNVRHDSSTKIKEYEESIKTKTPPVITPEPQTPPNGLTLEALEKLLSPITQRLNDYEAKETKANLISKVKASFTALNPDPKRQAAIDMAYELAFSNIGDGATSESVLGSVKSNYDRLVSIAGVDSGYVSLDSAGKGDPNSDLKSMLSQAESKEAQAIAGAAAVDKFLGLSTN